MAADIPHTKAHLKDLLSTARGAYSTEAGSNNPNKATRLRKLRSDIDEIVQALQALKNILSAIPKGGSAPTINIDLSTNPDVPTIIGTLGAVPSPAGAPSNPYSKAVSNTKGIKSTVARGIRVHGGNIGRNKYPRRIARVVATRGWQAIKSKFTVPFLMGAAFGGLTRWGVRSAAASFGIAAAATTWPAIIALMGVGIVSGAAGAYVTARVRGTPTTWQSLLVGAAGGVVGAWFTEAYQNGWLSGLGSKIKNVVGASMTGLGLPFFGATADGAADTVVVVDPEIEKQRLAALEQQRLAELEKQRLAALEQQRLAELEKQRLAGLEQQRLARLFDITRTEALGFVEQIQGIPRNKLPGLIAGLNSTNPETFLNAIKEAEFYATRHGERLASRGIPSSEAYHALRGLIFSGIEFANGGHDLSSASAQDTISRLYAGRAHMRVIDGDLAGARADAIRAGQGIMESGPGRLRQLDHLNEWLGRRRLPPVSFRPDARVFIPNRQGLYV